MNVAINILATFTQGYQGTKFEWGKGEIQEKNPPEFTFPHVL